jgi:hypothetical protein
LTGRRGAASRWGPHGVVAGLEEDRRQRCAWRRSRQLGRRGVVGDQPEERSVVLVDGSASSAVVGLGCIVTERRGAAVDSAVGVRGCAGYSDGRMKKRGELQRVASEGNATGCMVGTWSSSDTRRRQRRCAGAVGTAPARRTVRRRRACLKPTGVGTVALGWAQFSAQCCFAII